jgi:hypothetical protein
MSRNIFTGLFPNIPHESPANGMTTGKRKKSEVAPWSKSAWGFSQATTQP